MANPAIAGVGVGLGGVTVGVRIGWIVALASTPGAEDSTVAGVASTGSRRLCSHAPRRIAIMAIKGKHGRKKITFSPDLMPIIIMGLILIAGYRRNARNVIPPHYRIPCRCALIAILFLSQVSCLLAGYCLCFPGEALDQPGEDQAVDG